MTSLARLLRSPKLALVVLAFLAFYCLAAAWLPWTQPGNGRTPGWAARLGLEHPFTAPVFLAAAFLLFASTAVCTWDRTVRVFGLWRGDVRPYGVSFAARSAVRFEEFVRSEGFRGPGPTLYRFRPALWGGWVLHMGLLFLMAGILVQQGFYDGGAFEMSEGERVKLSTPSVVFRRDRGLLAPKEPPDVAVGLLAFDPFFHQAGYAPDRGSRLRLESPGRPAAEGFLDRAEGFDAGSFTIYQAIPSGLALTVDLGGLGRRSFHLTTDAMHGNWATAEFSPPGGGAPVRFFLEAERPLADPLGTGRIRLALETGGARTPLGPGDHFAFGRVTAHLEGISRWGGFTYSRSPGMPAVFSGFAAILLGTLLMTFPAGAAQTAGDEGAVAGWVYVTRGREALLATWGAARNRTGEEKRS